MAKILRWVALLFVVIGAVFVTIGAVSTVKSISFRSDAEHATGKIVEVKPDWSCSHRRSGGRDCNRVYKPVITFPTADGREVTFLSSYGTSSQPVVGSSVDVLYPADDPEAARMDTFGGFWLFPLIFGGIGLILLIVGVVMGGYVIGKSRQRAQLQRSGQRVLAQVQGVRRVDNVRINGRHPWQIVAVWQDPTTGQQHTFHSETIKYDPSAALGQNATIDVLVDPADPGRRYWMDLAGRAIDT